MSGRAAAPPRGCPFGRYFYLVQIARIIGSFPRGHPVIIGLTGTKFVERVVEVVRTRRFHHFAIAPPTVATAFLPLFRLAAPSAPPPPRTSPFSFLWRPLCAG